MAQIRLIYKVQTKVFVCKMRTHNAGLVRNKASYNIAIFQSGNVAKLVNFINAKLRLCP